MQTTLVDEATFEGVGVHLGNKARVVVRPAPAYSGITFVRVDLPCADGASGARMGREIPARYDHVVDTRLCTVIGDGGGAVVSTIEHLMAALAGLGVDNAEVLVDSSEVPIMDGSSAPFVEEITRIGLAEQRAPRRVIEILEPVSVRHGAASAELSPAPAFELSFEIDFEDAVIGRQEGRTILGEGVFAEELSRARTFGRLAEVEQLRKMGLAKGGSLENAIVVDGDRVLNPEGLRFPDEFVRHKMLDAVGDLALAGAPILGRYHGVRAGHHVTNLLLRKLAESPRAWRWVEESATPPAERSPRRSPAPAAGASIGVFGAAGLEQVGGA